ncbi:primosomal protein N' [Thiothrix subterranea]|uniref:Replication restart protein PriA n=1 Tax=Thiothrix subterranea TaxID=2735563 RepID=A0AA51MQ43_9GAMM|nr:primosomal protein N' [Thiothrix subterranea]MDQ5768312.1 primosomal protein N' [Thiothrix subterranea]WML87839.1 primosomal protein N' [Thiothrix subterranea]
MSQTAYTLQIAVPRPLRTLLSYSHYADAALPVGTRVLVPFGKQQSVGLVISAERAPETDNPDAPFTIKPVDAVLDAMPLPDAHLLELLQWAARYYHHPVGEVIFSALPVALRKPKPLSTRLQKLLVSSTPTAATSPNPARLQLTDEQQQCLHYIQQWNAQIPRRPILLHGITGSGKTEIYLRLIAPLFAAGKQVLVIVPEIGLTPQLLLRFAHFFGDTPMACLHSGLSDGDRLKAWLQARSGAAQIIIGTRSAIFTPAPHLALIVIDEEHDASLKQQEGFRYHARDLAIKRAQMLDIPILMGTATPSLEALYNAQTSRFHYARLERRPGTTRKPDLQIQDTRPFELQAGLTPQSLQAIRATLARGEQIMVFLNRRGFAPTLFCPSCGWHANCDHCSVKMTWHARRNRLVCHHCGAEQTTPLHCPVCKNPQLTTQGQGTERLELTLQTTFPDALVVRIDRDSTSRKGQLEDKLSTVRSNDPLILVGTQMLAKGHDFPNLTLVVIIDIDQSLLSTDYRALERLGQLLVQVAGRAGRADKPGRVILQTSQPDHPLLHQLVGHGYTPFARQLLEDRKRWHLPPFGYQALIRASSTASMEKALDFLEHVSQRLLAADGAGIQRLGPIPAPLEKRANRYRAQLLLGSQQRAALHNALHQLLQHAANLPGRSSVRWSIDIDPIEFS